MNAVKLCVTSLQNEQKNMRLNPKKKDVISDKISKKKNEITNLLEDVKSTFSEVEKQLKDQQSLINYDIQSSKQVL